MSDKEKDLLGLPLDNVIDSCVNAYVLGVKDTLRVIERSLESLNIENLRSELKKSIMGAHTNSKK